MKLINKNMMPVTIGVAFVWFTTQFGGGFASGAQLVQYFVGYGIIALITAVAVQGISAFFQWYALRFAYRHKTFDYRSYNDKLYGKFSPIFSNLYEIVYIMVLCLAPSVAFATGGSTLESLTGLPYIVCTLIIGVFIFVIAVFGTDVVRKAASTLSVIIIIGLLVVYIPNIIARWGDISTNMGTLAKQPLNLGPALWSMVLYFAFQLASVGLLVQHAEAYTDEKDAKKSMIYGFLVNGVIILIATVGIMAIATSPDLAKDSLPTLTLVKGGVGAPVLAPIISILIILGAVSTAVNMIAGATNRITAKFEKKEAVEKANGKPTPMTIIATLACVIVTFGIAQFGLLPLVKKGYGYLGYVTIAVVVIPMIIHMILCKMKKVD